MGIKSHIWRVHGEGINFKPKSHPPWNKGLTSSSDERVRQRAETLKRSYQSGKVINWCQGKTKETDQRLNIMAENISNTVFQKIKEGTWHNSFSKSRQHLYKGEKFDGWWEVYLANWFEMNSIYWIRNKKKFSYFFDSKKRNYVPDFYLPDIDCYVEVKGWKTNKDEAKWTQFPNRLIILSGSDLQLLGIPISVKKDWKQLMI